MYRNNTCWLVSAWVKLWRKNVSMHGSKKLTTSITKQNNWLWLDCLESKFFVIIWIMIIKLYFLDSASGGKRLSNECGFRWGAVSLALPEKWNRLTQRKLNFGLSGGEVEGRIGLLNWAKNHPLLPSSLEKLKSAWINLRWNYNMVQLYRYHYSYTHLYLFSIIHSK